VEGRHTHTLSRESRAHPWRHCAFAPALKAARDAKLEEEEG
jgi:hypothetical protein